LCLDMNGKWYSFRLIPQSQRFLANLKGLAFAHFRWLF
jgi:hypothetical protein